MAKIAEVLTKLKELLALKEKKRDLETKINSFDYPMSKEQLLEEKEEELNFYGDEKIGVPSELCGEPVAPENKPPVEPQKKQAPKLYPYNIIWMLRPPLFFLVIYLAFFVFHNDLIWSIYGIAWLFVWIIVGGAMGKESFSFFGFFKGFLHIIFLYKLIPYFSEKKKVEDYNENVYPVEYEKYEREKAEYQAQYDKEFTEFKEKSEARINARNSIIERKLEEYEPEAEVEAERQKAEYDSKTKEYRDEIEKLDAVIATYTGFDDSVAFHPDNFTVSELKDLISIIEDCRAGNIKEAMQLIREEERQERLEEQRREDARRQAEEAAQREAEQNRRMEYIEERRSRELDEHNKEVEKTLKASAQAQARAACMGCVMRDVCSHMITGDVPLNCTMYRGTGFRYLGDNNKKN